MVEFPTGPSTGQQWVAENGVTYTWLGDRWNSAIALQLGTAAAYVDGGRAETTHFDITIDGGTA